MQTRNNTVYINFNIIKLCYVPFTIFNKCIKNGSLTFKLLNHPVLDNRFSAIWNAKKVICIML